MKKLLYLLLKKDMIKKLSKKHGTQFVDDVMATFGMPTDTTDVRQRTLFDKLKYWFICRKKGHTVSRVHPKYPSQYCSVCWKHRSEF